MKAFAFVAAALCTSLLSQTSAAACYVVYGPGQKIVYRSPLPPVDLSRPLHETLPAVAPGGALVFSLDNYGCESEIHLLKQRLPAVAEPDFVRATRARRS